MNAADTANSVLCLEASDVDEWLIALHWGQLQQISKVTDTDATKQLIFSHDFGKSEVNVE